MVGGALYRCNNQLIFIWRQSMNQLSECTLRSITTGQVITSIFTVVKELVENALDARATKVVVKLIDFGLEKIQVQDNGTGLNYSDVAYMCLPHYTSKITCFDDLTNLNTYGFRGEALSSICAVAKVVVTTKTNENTTANTFHFLRSGKVDESLTKPSAGETGTIISVTDLFGNVPVRRACWNNPKKLKEEVKNIELLLTAYGIAYPNLRLLLFNNHQKIFSKNNFDNINDVLRFVWGNLCFSQMKYNYINKHEEFRVESFFPVVLLENERNKANYFTDKRFIIINKRPVLVPEISKMIKEKLMSIGLNRPTAYCVIINVLPMNLEVNLEPNKTRVLLRQKESIFSTIENVLELEYSSCNENVTKMRSNNGVKIPQIFNTQNNLTDKQVPKIKSGQNSFDITDDSLMDKDIKPKNQLNFPSNFQKNGTKSFGEIQTKASYDQNKTKDVESDIFDDVDLESTSRTNVDYSSVSSDKWRTGNLRDSRKKIFQPVQLASNGKRGSTSPIQNKTISKKSRLNDVQNLIYSLTQDQIVKEPATPYMVFAQKIRKQVVNENPNVEFRHLGKMISNKWQSLDTEHRNKYKTLSLKIKPKKCAVKMATRNVTTQIFKWNQLTQLKKEVAVNFDIDKLKITLEQTRCRKTEKINVIGRLKGGPWFVRIDTSIGTLNQFGAKELEFFQNLLENHKLSMKALDSPLVLTEGLVGGQKHWSVLLNMSKQTETTVYHSITDNRLIYNGLKVRTWTDPDSNLLHAELTHVNDSVPFYGVIDLKQILTKLIENKEISLFQSRPLSVINYFKAEAVRMCRQLPIEMSNRDIYSCINYLLEKLGDLRRCKCIHGRRIFDLIAIGIDYDHNLPASSCSE